MASHNELKPFISDDDTEGYGGQFVVKPEHETDEPEGDSANGRS